MVPTVSRLWNISNHQLPWHGGPLIGLLCSDRLDVPVPNAAVLLLAHRSHPQGRLRDRPPVTRQRARAGNTRYYSAAKLGGPENSLREAQRAINELDLPKPKPRGGSATGRVLPTSKTKSPGIRFVWTPGQDAPRLHVVATWIDKKGKNRSTSYSVESTGIELTRDSAIMARTSDGADMPDKVQLLRLLRKQYRTGPTE